MAWFARIEQACAAFIERTFARTFPSDLEPAQIARKLVAVMEARTEPVDGRSLAPSRYTALVNPLDFARLQPHRDHLQTQWSTLLLDVGGRVGIEFHSGDPQVALESADDVVPGAVEIETDALAQRPADTTATPRYALRMVKGVPAGQRYRLLPKMTIGRGQERDIALPDPGVSRDHASIELDAGGAILRDRGSTNGTFVNGRRIAEQRLRDGDSVAFGKTVMRFEETAQP